MYNINNLLNKVLFSYKRRVFLSIFFLMFTFFFNIYAGRVIIPLLAPVRYPMVDITFLILPYIKEAWIISELLTFSLLFVFIYFLHKNEFKDLDRYILGVGLMYLLRSFTIILNPVEHSWLGYDNRFDSLIVNPTSDVNGFYFSGHISWTTLFVFYITKMEKRFLYFGILIIILNVLLILLSRSHYSIDLFGGITIAFLIMYILGIFPLNNRKSSI